MNVSGKLNLIVFDKTGTLTEDGLDVLGVCSAEGDVMGELKEILTPLKENDVENLSIVEGMATCHGLKWVGEGLVGDPMDLKIFEQTRWRFEESTEYGALAPTLVHPPPCRYSSTSTSLSAPPQFAIMRVFEFSSVLRRMSVVSRCVSHPSLHVYTKGLSYFTSNWINFSTHHDSYSLQLTLTAILSHEECARVWLVPLIVTFYVISLYFD